MERTMRGNGKSIVNVRITRSQEFCTAAVQANTVVKSILVAVRYDGHRWKSALESCKNNTR